MKTKVVAVLVLLLVTGNALGQDFKKVIEIVDEMETSLKGMISREQAERKNEIASLRNEVVALRQSLATAPTSRPQRQHRRSPPQRSRIWRGAWTSSRSGSAACHRVPISRS